MEAKARRYKKTSPRNLRKSETVRKSIINSLVKSNYIIHSWCEKGDSNPLPPSNISDLTPKLVRAIAYKRLICVQIAYKI